MEKKSKTILKIVVVLCVSLMLAFAGVASAHDGKGGCSCGKQQYKFKKLAKKLGLTDAQKAQVKSIFQANKEALKPTLTSLHTERANLEALIHADTIDEAAIRAETAKIAGIQADLNVNRAKDNAKFRAILTPAQLATLKTLKQQHQKMEDTDAE